MGEMWGKGAKWEWGDYEGMGLWATDELRGERGSVRVRGCGDGGLSGNRGRCGDGGLHENEGSGVMWGSGCSVGMGGLCEEGGAL